MEMQQRKLLVQGLSGYARLADLRCSPFFAEHGPEIDYLLSSPEIIHCPAAAPRLRSFLRIAQWNIEKGKRFDAVLKKFEHDEVLKWADVIVLNEADVGMIRSANRHVAEDLAERLSMHMVFGPAHLELCKGVGEEAAIEGHNRDSLQGNAVLSRYPILEARVVTLPNCFEPYEFDEKRYGWRNCVWARLKLRETDVWIGSTHLEVRGTPNCRGLQMKHAMDHLPGGVDEPYLLGGDFNSNGFRRGTTWRSLVSIMRLIASQPERMKLHLLHPERGDEPLFGIVKLSGFGWEGLNSDGATSCAPIAGLDEAGMLPKLLARVIQRRLEPYGGHLHLKLDWFIGRKIRSLRGRELLDPETGVASLEPGILNTEWAGAERISDHAPIHADLRI
jgi:endonuclease/exonuclease/phosphatase family metal-dependent hydrolase